MTLKLGLTGSIATGKSTVLDMFARRGIPVFSADEAVHALYRGEAVPVVERLFPGTTQRGEVDRAALGRRLLGRPDDLRALEQAIHPLVRARLGAFVAKAEAEGAPLAVIDIPLLFETGYDYGLDRIAVTVVDPAVQRRRALARPGMNVEKLAAILARQLPQSDKQRRADYVIDTGRPLRETEAMIERLVATLVAEGSA